MIDKIIFLLYNKHILYRIKKQTTERQIIIMYVADMHSDSLLTVNSERGLLNNYNTSKTYPYIQAFAAYVPFRGRTADVRRAELMRLCNVYIYETDRLGIRRIDDVRGLCSATDESACASVFTVEGGGGLFADSDELLTLHKMGMRIMSLAWETNELAAGAFDEDDTGLTKEGKRMVRKCAELGITIDVSHLSDRSFWQLCDAYPLPIIATHSNLRDVCGSKRNLTLEEAREIALRGGVIGLNLYPDFIRNGEAKLEDILFHVDYALEKLGERALGFGFDIDGTNGKYPIGLDEGSSIHDRVIEMLLKHYSASVVEKIAGENVIDFYKGIF